MIALTIIAAVIMFLLSIGLPVMFGFLNHKRIRICIIAGVAGIIISAIYTVFVPAGLYKIDTGEIAVIKTNGSITSVERDGLHWRNVLFQKVERYDIKIRAVGVEKEAYSKDLQAVRITMNIQYSMQIDKVKELVATYGSLDTVEQRISTIANEAIEEAAKLFEAQELVTRRNEFNAAIKENIGNKYNNYYITVSQTILSDVVFTPEYEALIQKTKLAEQEIERAKLELEKQLQEAEYKVKLAEQAAAEAKAKAKGDYDKQILLAEAEAEQVKLIAQAEAEAIALKQAAIDNLSAESRAYLEIIAFIEQWDGQLPQTFLTDLSALLATLNISG
jgi:regulator of protease activity HflC (stomatin/prohibitin superfamily)